MEVEWVLSRETHYMKTAALRNDCGKSAAAVDALAVAQTAFFLLSGQEER